MEIPGDLVCEEGFVRRAVNRNVDWEVIGLRDLCSERGGKGVAVEVEIDYRSKLTARIRPGVESQAACCNVSGKITMHQHRGANNLRGE